MGNAGIRDVLSLVEQVYDNTRKAILEGRYKPGQRLRLQEIASENNASFIPVREALRLLEAGRLVEIIPNKGARVSEISEADMLDAYMMRTTIECMAIERTCSMISPDELERADQLYNDMMAAFEVGDVEESSALHREFHMALYRPARSPWMLHLIELLMSNTDRYRRLLTPARPTGIHLEITRQQHREILDGVRAGDAALAGEALRRHLADTQKRFLQGLGERV